MATALLAWELGAGLGHLTTLRPVAQRMAEEGHDVHLVVRDLACVETVFGDLEIPLYQAPVEMDHAAAAQRAPRRSHSSCRIVDLRDLPSLSAA